MSYPCPHTTTDGVYKSGFARSQQAYEDAVYKLFDSLDRLETILTGKDYLVGDRLTEADVRLFVTIVCTRAPTLHPRLSLTARVPHAADPLRRGVPRRLQV